MKILLRFVENAPVALFQTSSDSVPEQLATRYDLYQYRGGVAWGYKGSAAQNLSFAIVSRMTNDTNDKDIIYKRADILLNGLICNLDESKEHDLLDDHILSVIAHNTELQSV